MMDIITMNKVSNDFFALLRSAINGEPFRFRVTDSEWYEVFILAQKQLLEGLIWPVVKDRKLPLDIAFQWIGVAERIRGLNELQNKEASRLTRLFEEAGRKSAILKGQANARLYPDKFMRTPGDIDIWVEGGREIVLEFIIGLGLLDERPTIANLGKMNTATESYHHVHLPLTNEGVEVEVHFRSSSGSHCPWTNQRLQRWLEDEIQYMSKVEEGFYVPSIRFALMMQMSHIQRHFLSSGVGMRQICDYYLLLRNSTEDERQTLSGLLASFGLRHTAGALMWVLKDVLHLDDELMICNPDEWRGIWMLRDVMEGGNFGHYSHAGAGKWKRFLESKIRHFKLMRFDFWEVVWIEIDYWCAIVRTLPERVRRGRLSLRDD